MITFEGIRLRIGVVVTDRSRGVRDLQGKGRIEGLSHSDYNAGAGLLNILELRRSNAPVVILNPALL